jgi:dienelactone hydrolase
MTAAYVKPAMLVCAMVAAALALPANSAQAQAYMRLEIHAVPTVTLSGEQFLTGDKYGRPTMLGGELRIPKPGADKLPAVILVHGSGGLSASADRWARELNEIGVAVFMLDSFTGRGIVSTANDQSQLNSLAMMVDAYAALGQLAAHPRIDPARIAVMGFSKGAVASVYSSNERFRKMYAPGGVEFAAHIGLYTPCNVAYRDDTRTSGKPIRLFHGIADDYVSIAPCRAYVERLKKAEADVTLTEYPDAHHAYDNFTISAPIKNPDGQTTRNCLLEEGANGQILNSKTGKPYELASDPCVEKGPQVAYNAAAHQATVAAVKEFLQKTFALK